MITVNGITYHGDNVTIKNNQVWVDGIRQFDGKEIDEKIINITIDSNIENLHIDNCDKIKITGDCGSVVSKNGNIQTKGNVHGDVISKNGNIVCRDVNGNVETKNGNIVHS